MMKMKSEKSNKEIRKVGRASCRLLSPVRDPARGRGDEGAGDKVGCSDAAAGAQPCSVTATVDREPGPEAGDSTRAQRCHERWVYHAQPMRTQYYLDVVEGQR
ncbi:hypothetical protein O1611_g3301 [Lasiodiplodia mahajangana]|uniref:Uncharacterized protein n=1 Tax=Lasiodiplodia mahajangana TaxID=1108764 RepID=A0ACC2JT09_9PEZI|nr:hypothetical protein O1611_g3301 [Lasiodiplodia mahajangana]